MRVWRQVRQGGPSPGWRGAKGMGASRGCAVMARLACNQAGSIPAEGPINLDCKYMCIFVTQHFGMHQCHQVWAHVADKGQRSALLVVTARGLFVCAVDTSARALCAACRMAVQAEVAEAGAAAEGAAAADGRSAAHVVAWPRVTSRATRSWPRSDWLYAWTSLAYCSTLAMQRHSCLNGCCWEPPGAHPCRAPAALHALQQQRAAAGARVAARAVCEWWRIPRASVDANAIQDYQTCL